ncbi:MAG: V-type ATP synthase subunit E [Firmicutes bacterium]|nr:V-type ATP synthase subunit E [Bacillota bacterium]
MNRGQNIIEKILSDARAEAAKIEETARLEAEKTIAEAKEKAEKEKLKIETASADEAARAAAKEISSAEMRAKQMILSAKQKCIEDIVNAAKQNLAQLSDQEYSKVILGMIGSAKPSEGCDIILSAADKAKLADEITKQGYVVAEETRDISGGFIIRKGDIEYNYSFESIISVEKEDIDLTAAKILFA